MASEGFAAKAEGHKVKQQKNIGWIWLQFLLTDWEALSQHSFLEVGMMSGEMASSN